MKVGRGERDVRGIVEKTKKKRWRLEEAFY